MAPPPGDTHMVADAPDAPQQAPEAPVARVLADDSALAALNARAAEQSLVDKVAVEETNTRLRYNRFQKEYHEYCVVVHGDDKDSPITITVDRVYNFLYYHAYRNSKQLPPQPGKRKRKGRNKSRPPPPVATYPKYFDHAEYTNVFNGYEDREASATDLSSDFKFIGYSHLNNMKSALLDVSSPELKQKIRLDDRIRNLIKHVKARKGIQARERKEEKVTAEMPHYDLMPRIHELEQSFWDRHSDTADPKTVASALRDRWCFNDSLQCIIRAESLWKEELSDMLHYTHHHPGEPIPYEVSVRCLWEGKTNQKSTGKALLAQCFRHVDPKKCAIGAKALYLFARFRVTEEEFDFTDNAWFKVKTAVVLADRGNSKEKDFTKSMGNGTYKDVLKSFQEHLNFISGKLIHFGRKFGSYYPQLDGVPATETCTLGNWACMVGVVFQKHYSAKVPFSAMRSCAGCGKDVGRYYLARSEIKPPQELLEQVWPCIERAKQALLATEGNARFVTAHRFINAMDHLRVVLLQDAAYFITQEPDRAKHVIFTDPLFHTAEFKRYLDRFDREYKHKLLPENDPTLQKVQLLVPRIGNALEMVVRQAQNNDGKLTDIGKALEEDGEAAHQARLKIYQDMMTRFEEIETNYLSPIAQDVHFVANFFRSGVAGTVGASPPRTALETRAFFNQVAQQRILENSLPDEEPAVPTPSPEVDHGYSSPARRRGLSRESTCSPVARPILPGVPPSNKYNCLSSMYWDWVGAACPEKSLKVLFEDTDWRRENCPKNSASMKRMQRMKNICSYVERYLVDSGIDVEQEILANNINGAIDGLVEKVFGTKKPTAFSWTGIERGLKEYYSS